MSNDANAVTPTPTPAPVIDMAAYNAALEKAARLEAQIAERTQQEEQQKLASEFPAIKDWGIVAGTNFNEKRAAAAKMVAMFAPAPEPKKAEAPAPAGNPGDTFTPPPMGAPGGEAGQAQAVIQKRTDLLEAVQKGNVGRALDLCVELNPKGFNNWIQGAR